MTDWVTLNVGGQKFTTTKAVMTSVPNSLLARTFEHEEAMQQAARDEDGAYLIDANPDYFKPILQFLRRGKLIIDPGMNLEGVLEEAKYLGLVPIVRALRRKMREESNSLVTEVGEMKAILAEKLDDINFKLNDIEDSTSALYLASLARIMLR